MLPHAAKCSHVLANASKCFPNAPLRHTYFYYSAIVLQIDQYICRLHYEIIQYNVYLFVYLLIQLFININGPKMLFKYSNELWGFGVGRRSPGSRNRNCNVASMFSAHTLLDIRKSFGSHSGCLSGARSGAMMKPRHVTTSP